MIGINCPPPYGPYSLVLFCRAAELYYPYKGELADHSAGRGIFVAKKRIILSILSNNLPPHCINIGGNSRPRTPAARGCLLHTCYSGSQRRNRQ
jgi:hypothetical protein